MVDGVGCSSSVGKTGLQQNELFTCDVGDNTLKFPTGEISKNKPILPGCCRSWVACDRHFC